MWTMNLEEGPMLFTETGRAGLGMGGQDLIPQYSVSRTLILEPLFNLEPYDLID